MNPFERETYLILLELALSELRVLGGDEDLIQQIEDALETAKRQGSR